MKAQEFHDMTINELLSKQKELKEELFNLRFSHATGQLANPLLLNKRKKDIARIKTILRERELGLDKTFAKKDTASKKAKA